MRARRNPHGHEPTSSLEESSNPCSTIGSTVTSRFGTRVFAGGNSDAMRWRFGGEQATGMTESTVPRGSQARPAVILRSVLVIAMSDELHSLNRIQ